MEPTVYVWYDRPLWHVGLRRRHSESLFSSTYSTQAKERARLELKELGGGLLRHYDVNGFLQGEEWVRLPEPESPRQRLSPLAR